MVDSTLAQLAGTTVFSKLDTNSGFWQVPLSPESRPLTTFITPMDRYCFNKLPFGLSSASEHFQKCMNELLADIPRVVCQIDDILIFVNNQEVHDQWLHTVLSRLRSKGLTLNASKCNFRQSSIDFLGHIIDRRGVSPDPRNTEAIQKMAPLSSLTELRRFMGMINQLNKFSPRITDLSQPLRELLNPKKAWVWTPAQDNAFQKVKEEIASPRVLALYDVDKDTKVNADASAYGLGGVLLQTHGEHWRPVAFASRALTETESRYAQIEKEALALTWACEKFTNYILVKLFELETDHKSLVPILGNKSLDSLPPRVLRFRLCLMRFQYTVHHCPGKSLYLADALSRAPVKGPPEEVDKVVEREAEKYLQAVISSIPANKDCLDVYRQVQEEDTECSKLIDFCKSGWPKKAIAVLKAIFARHGVPLQFVSDNGPQFDFFEMKVFAETYGFRHITSSPYYPQSNGLAERAVKSVKQLLQTAPDPHMALLSYRATPLPSCRLIPAEFLMGRRIRTDVPQLKKLLIPDWPYLENFRKTDERHKQNQMIDVIVLAHWSLSHSNNQLHPQFEHKAK